MPEPVCGTSMRAMCAAATSASSHPLGPWVSQVWVCGCLGCWSTLCLRCWSAIVLSVAPRVSRVIGPLVSLVWVRGCLGCGSAGVLSVGPRVSRMWVRRCLGYNVQHFQVAAVCDTLRQVARPNGPESRLSARTSSLTIVAVESTSDILRVLPALEEDVLSPQ
jgi:hypothetical protein